MNKAEEYVDKRLLTNLIRLNGLKRPSTFVYETDSSKKHRIVLSILYSDVFFPEDLITMITILSEKKHEQSRIMVYNDLILDIIRTFWVKVYIGLKEEENMNDEDLNIMVYII